MRDFILIESTENRKERKRICCNCGNNIRTGDIGSIKCHCAIDGHYIGYVECFEGWCRRWKKERKWDDESISK